MAYIGAIVSAVGSLAGGAMSQSGQNSANSMNRKQAQQNNMLNAYISSHGHRIEMNDLKKAGLNPILTATGGRGVGPFATSSSNTQNESGVGVASALDALRTITTAFLTDKQAERTKAETANTIAKTETELQQPEVARAQSGLLREQAVTAKATQAQLAADTRLKQVGSLVALSELDKNKELTKLFQSQGLTEVQQARLLSLNADHAAEVLKGLRNDGTINESTYGQALRWIDRSLETINRVPFLNRFAPRSKKDDSRDSRNYPSYRRR